MASLDAPDPDTNMRCRLYNLVQFFHDVVLRSHRVTKTSTLVMRFENKPQSLDLNSHYNQLEYQKIHTLQCDEYCQWQC